MYLKYIGVKPDPDQAPNPNPKVVFRNLRKMSAKITVEAEALKESFSKEHGENDGVNQVFRLINRRSKKVIMSLGG